MPKFKHDCDRCKFLGTISAKFQNIVVLEGDAYICSFNGGSDYPRNLMDTVIFRYGNDGYEYSSHSLSEDMIQFFLEYPDRPLSKVYFLAKEKDLTTFDKV